MKRYRLDEGAVSNARAAELASELDSSASFGFVHLGAICNCSRKEAAGERQVVVQADQLVILR